MKKSILVLSVLLFLLILSCVYQNTYTLYEKYHNTNASILTIASPTPVSAPKQAISEVTIPHSNNVIQKPIKPSIVAQVTPAKKAETKVVEKSIPDSKTNIEDTDTTAHKKEPQIIFAKKQDLEEIDSLLEALKRRDIALKHRDDLILRIQQLIKQALDNRSTVIQDMNKDEQHLLQVQKELLKTRDIAYDKIGQPNIPTSGK